MGLTAHSKSPNTNKKNIQITWGRAILIEVSCGSLFIYFNSHPIKPRILTTYDWVSDAVLRLVVLRPINPNRTKGTIL